LFVALAPLLKGIGAVLGQIIKQAFSTIGTIITILTPVIRIISAVLGPVLNKVMSDPTVFSESELRQIGTAMQDGSLKPTVDRLLKSNDFRLKVGL